MKIFKYILLLVISFSFAFCGGNEGDNGVEEPMVVIDPDPVVVEPENSNAPSSNFNLSQWNISIPVNRGDGISTNISVADLNAGYENSNFFYSADDGGMVFKCFVSGPKTSENTSYTRTELREMLRGTNTSINTQGVNKNNWVLGTAPQADIMASGGYNGLLEATLAVNYVTTTGSSGHKGRVIIGQIHANDNEPCRLYYRKLENNIKGSIYFAHEPADNFGNEQYIEMIGSRSNNASDPEDGIALDEKFSYTIEVEGDDLTVTIIREGKENVSESISMTNSGYSNGEKYQYFKAGVYNQNNTGDSDDYVQATFYSLKQSHSSL